MRAIVIGILCGALGGCVHGSNGVSRVPVGAACPAVKTYSAGQQRTVRAELAACGARCKSLSGWIKDYHVLRQQVRACRKTK